MSPKLSQNQMPDLKETKENESCSTTWVDSKTVVKPYSNPLSSPFGPHKTRMTPKLSQSQMSEFKES